MKNLIYTIIFSFITISCQLADSGNNTDEKPMISITDSITSEDFTNRNNTFSFDRTCETESRENTFKIKNSGTKKLTIDSIYLEGSNLFTLDTSEVKMELLPEESTTFKAYFAPLKYGEHIEETKIFIKSNAFNKNNYMMYISTVGVSARNIIEVYEDMLNPIYVSNEELFSLNINEFLLFKIKNNINATMPLEVYSIEFNGSEHYGFTNIIEMDDNFMKLVPGGGSSYFKVDFVPTVQGTFHGSITIRSNYLHDDTFKINFQSTY